MSLHRDCEDCGWREELEEKNSRLIRETEQLSDENTDLRDELDKVKNELREVKAMVKSSCREIMEILNYME